MLEYMDCLAMSIQHIIQLIMAFMYRRHIDISALAPLGWRNYYVYRAAA